MNFSKICVILGLLAMAHAAYSAAQRLYPDRTYLRLTEQEFTSLPLDIILQCFVGLILTCYGVVHISGIFKEIRANADLDNKSWDMLSSRQSMYSFNHRGVALYRDRG